MMGGIKHEQDAMREEINPRPPVPVPNHVIYGLPPGSNPSLERTHVLPHVHTSRVADGFVAQGLPIVNQIPISRTNEEFQDEFEMKNYSRATPAVVPTTAQDYEDIIICSAQYPIMPYRLIAHAHIPAPVPQYQAPQPQYQELIDEEILSFADVMNVGNNPLPKHGGSGVNAIKSLTDEGFIKDMFELKTPLIVGHARLLEAELMKQFTRVKVDEDVIMIVLEFDQEKLPKPLVVHHQRNSNPTPMKKIDPMVIHVPIPFSFNNTKAVPWDYDPAVYVGDKPMILKELDMTNITGASVVTQNEMVFLS
ncbi:hypothetical protein KIW84_061079 [Lathyrus oleraceus]|uniref:Uncharacterized protein n=1 Tax=Pisum sativum TaxID=3888 RepID=A0A9D4W1E4_PEA|nr:hypothetical protein KIW84_061079 [Pisum sativum]